VLKQFKAALEQVPRDPRIGMFKQEHENHIYGFVDDCDRRIKMAQRKLEKTPEENRKTVDLVSNKSVSFWHMIFLRIEIARSWHFVVASELIGR